jgi:hypothetical protein
VQVLLAQRLNGCLAEWVRHVEAVRDLLHPRGIAGTTTSIEFRVQAVGTPSHESLACGIQPVPKGGPGQVLHTHERRLEMMCRGLLRVEQVEVSGDRTLQAQSMAAPPDRVPTESRTKDREALRERVTSAIRGRIGPKQLDEPVALHGSICGLECEVDQQRKVLSRTKPLSPIAVDDQCRGAKQANVGLRGLGHRFTTILNKTINTISTPCYYYT